MEAWGSQPGLKAKAKDGFPEETEQSWDGRGDYTFRGWLMHFID